MNIALRRNTKKKGKPFQKCINKLLYLQITLCKTFQKTENGILYTRGIMNHLKTVSDDAMSLLRTIIKLNVADVKEIIYIFAGKRDEG